MLLKGPARSIDEVWLDLGSLFHMSAPDFLLAQVMGIKRDVAVVKHRLQQAGPENCDPPESGITVVNL